MRSGSGSAHLARAISRTSLCALARATSAVCCRSTSSICSPQRHHRVERGHRLLEDHRHARAAQLAQPRSRSRAISSSPSSSDRARR